MQGNLSNVSGRHVDRWATRYYAESHHSHKYTLSLGHESKGNFVESKPSSLSDDNEGKDPNSILFFLLELK